MASLMEHMNSIDNNASDESFELLKHLGASGFAHTYLARVLDGDLQHEFGTDQVVLTIPLSRKHASQLARVFELNAYFHLKMMGLGAVGVVRFLGIHVFRGVLVCVMQHMSGGSLRQLISKSKSTPRMPVEQTMRTAIQVLGGIATLHDAQILLRGVTPSDILLDGDTVAICIPSTAILLELEDGAVAGCFPYMAPESFDGHPTFSSDIWSVGVLMFEMLTGRWPFGESHTSMGEMVELIRKGGHATVCEVCTEVSVELSIIIGRALQKHPADRFADAQAMLKALSAVALQAVGQPTDTRPKPGSASVIGNLTATS